MDIGLSAFFADLFVAKKLILAKLNTPRKQLSRAIADKISVRPVEIRGKVLYQVSEQRGEKEIHRNLTCEECRKLLLESFSFHYKQAMIFTEDKDYLLIAGSKGEASIHEKPPTKSPLPLLHNRQKQHLLQEGVPLPFLIELGIMNKDGKVRAEKRDKFVQINRFLEMAADVLSSFKDRQPLYIVDLGCGKAYLTFSLYYFLKEVKGFDVHMTGLDLKKDVIEYCSSLADKLGYKTLTFLAENISSYIPSENIDIVVALHACDTATDHALNQAVKWNAKIILTAPCCQHELNNQIASEDLNAIIHYGILKERLSALATDAARAQILEMHGYSTQVIEFIDSGHTPKNLLIRAVLGNSQERRTKAKKTFFALKEALHITPCLETLLEKNGK